MGKGFKCGSDFSETVFNEMFDKKKSIELLWENSSPTSEFAKITIELDFAQYSFIGIAWKKEGLILYDSGSFGDKENPSEFFMTSSTNWSDGGITASRILFFRKNADKISVDFRDCKAHYWGNDEVEITNGLCVPFRIYGIKGVS